MRRAVSILAFAACATCHEGTSSLPIHARGCAAVYRGPHCAVDGSAELTVFAATSRSIGVTIDGRDTDVSTTAVDGGLRFVIRAAANQRIEIRAGDAIATIRTVAVTDHDAVNASRAARALLRKGERDAALDALEASATALENAGHVSAAALDRQARAYTLVYGALRLADAAIALDRAEPLLAHFGEGRATQPYYRGLLALESGDYRAAVDHLRTAQTRLERLGMTRIAAAAREAEVAALETLGAHDEAIARLGPLAAAPIDCATAGATSNDAWVRLIGAEALRRHVEPTLVSNLTAAVRILDGETCEDSRAATGARVHLALAHVLRGEGADAIAALDGTADIAPDVDYWREEVLGRAYLVKRDGVRARRHLERAADIAAKNAMTDKTWRARTFVGDAWSVDGDQDRARASYRAAEQILEDRSLDLPLGAGRASFLGDRSHSARRLAASLLDGDRAVEAACVLRQANRRLRARAARAGRLARLDDEQRGEWQTAIGAYRQLRRTLDAQRAEEWDLSVEERAARAAQHAATKRRAEQHLEDALRLIEGDVRLTADCDVLDMPSDGERFLLVDRIAPERWVAISFGTSDAAFSTSTETDGPAAVAALLAATTKDANTVRVLAMAATESLDVHRLVVGDEVLAAAKNVVYSLDLVGNTRRVARTPRALVVGNPTRNLRAATREADAVASALAQRGLDVDRRIGRVATANDVRAALPHATTFHFSGHGHAGNGGVFDDHLALADGTLSAADVLALPSVPELVVLSGCRTGASSQLNLATSFLLAGADVVIATTRDITDEEGVAFGASFHSSASPDETFEPIDAYRRAAASAVSGWSAYRVWVK